MPGFWAPRLLAAAVPGLSLSPWLSLCRKLYPKPEVPEGPPLGLVVGEMEEVSHRVWGQPIWENLPG